MNRESVILGYLNHFSNFILFTISLAIRLWNGLFRSVPVSLLAPYFAGQRHQIAVINLTNVGSPTCSTTHTSALISFPQQQKQSTPTPLRFLFLGLIKVLIVSYDECYVSLEMSAVRCASSATDRLSTPLYLYFTVDL